MSSLSSFLLLEPDLVLISSLHRSPTKCNACKITTKQTQMKLAYMRSMDLYMYMCMYPYMQELYVSVLNFYRILITYKTEVNQ